MKKAKVTIKSKDLKEGDIFTYLDCTYLKNPDFYIRLDDGSLEEYVSDAELDETREVMLLINVKPKS